MRSQVRSTAVAALAVATLIPAATAYADPSPQLPQTSPQTPQGQDSPQTPVTPTPPQSTSPISPGSPGIAPAPPSGPTVSPSTDVPSVSPAINTAPPTYDVIPSGPIHAPKPTRDVPRQEWKPDTITLGNIEWKIDDLDPNLRRIAKDNPRAIVSFNDWSAYGASQIARFLISIGIPEDEATRQASAAIIGGVVGGAAGGAIAFTATAIVVGVVVIPVATLAGTAIGAGIGSLVPPTPFQAGPGALIGAGSGLAVGVGITLATALAAGVAGAVAGGTIGAAITWALGTGDPHANLTPPSTTDPDQPDQRTNPLPNPDGNQFELHLPRSTAETAGLPGGGTVDYVVTQRGDVTVSASIGGRDFTGGWTAEQAQAPIKALGGLAPAATKAINDGVRTLTDQATKALPGLEVAWPQLDEKNPAPATKTGKHRR